MHLYPEIFSVRLLQICGCIFFFAIKQTYRQRLKFFSLPAMTKNIFQTKTLLTPNTDCNEKDRYIKKSSRISLNNYTLYKTKKQQLSLPHQVTQFFSVSFSNCRERTVVDVINCRYTSRFAYAIISNKNKACCLYTSSSYFKLYRMIVFRVQGLR